MQSLINKFNADDSLANAIKIVKYTQKHPMAVASLSKDSLDTFNRAKAMV
jgi:hypothetical protein